MAIQWNLLDQTLFPGCGLVGMESLDESSVDLVLTDLPAGITRAEFDKQPDLQRFFEASWRILKPRGIILAMAANIRFASKIVDVESKFFRYDLVWQKTMGTGFFNAKKQPLRNHEHILIFYRKPGTYNPQMSIGHGPIHANRRDKGHGMNYGAPGVETCARKGATDRYPISVISTGVVGTTSADRIHPQQKPLDLLKWLVKTYSNPSDLIVDPFAGSGSTGVAALSLGRQFMGWEITAFG